MSPISEVRDGVRAGILTALEEDVEQRGARTVGRLLAAGAIGVLGALGATLLVTRHPMGHHPSWHGVVFGSIWAGLLVVSLSIAFLRVRSPRFPFAKAALVGILGLGLAGACGAACSDQHFLAWWSATAIGGEVTAHGGSSLGALCFGLMTTTVVAAVSAFVVLGRSSISTSGVVLAASFLFLLLVPGVALQSVDTPIGVWTSWLMGTALGALGGVVGGAWLGSALRSSGLASGERAT